MMTDIRAAHRADIQSVLVKPLVKSDAWNTGIAGVNAVFGAKLEEKYGKIQYQKRNLMEEFMYWLWCQNSN